MTLRHKILLISCYILVLLSTSAFSLLPQVGSPVVKAVLFWMQGCPHCHEVIDTVLPPIQAKYGEQLQIKLIELTGSQEINALYSLAESMGIPKNDVGVPFLIIGEHVLVGSGEIPDQLPGLIDSYLAAGGVDFPDSPALAPLLQLSTADTDSPTASTNTAQTTQTTGESAQSQATASPASVQTDPAQPGEVTTFQGENGFVFAWLTIFFLLAVLAFSLVYLLQARNKTGFERFASAQVLTAEWWLPLLAFIGLGVAAYLAYVETQAVRAFCGPIGDCNTVQSSPYARLFGILPIGVLGVIGYALILAAWWVKRSGSKPWSDWSALALFGMTFGGTLFSVYLTYLEVTVIRAVCMWCVSSALIMGGLLLLSLPSRLSNPKGLADL